MFLFHHVTISVRDARETEEFYSKLGFTKVFTYEAEDRSLEITHLKNDRVVLELFCYANPKEAPEFTKDLATDLPTIGVRHFALQVESVEKAKDELIALGIHPAMEITKGRTGIDYFFIKDPDGILVEIVEDKRNL